MTVKIYDTLNLYAGDLTIGQHGAWWPGEGIKVPFQWGGRIQKYRHPHEGVYDLALLGEEWALLAALAEHRMAPPVGDWVYFKTVISEHLGAYWADPCGAYGYRMADANSLPPGALNPAQDIPRQIRTLGLPIGGSPGAWNDLNKPGNVINGYLVDARRSGWDRLRWWGPAAVVPHYVEDEARLQQDLVRDGQFPFRERTQPYQEYWLDGRWHPGEREVTARAAVFDFPHQLHARHTVLDLGTQLGGFLHHVALLAPSTAQAGYLVGVDSNPAYVELAQRLARANRWNLCFRAMSVEDPALVDWIRTLWPGGVTHLLLLSMLKHLSRTEQTLWELVDAFAPTYAYVETNAVKEGLPAPLLVAAQARGGDLVGWSHDRNRRACYRIPVAAR